MVISTTHRLIIGVCWLESIAYRVEIADLPLTEADGELIPRTFNDLVDARPLADSLSVRVPDLLQARLNASRSLVNAIQLLRGLN